MLQSDDLLWRELRYAWGTAAGTSRYIQQWSKVERSTADIWEDVYEDFCDGTQVWSAGIALLPHLTNLASMSIGTAKAHHLLFAAAILLHCVTLDGGRIRNLTKVLPNGDVSPNRKLLSQMKCWIREAQVQGKTLIPHLFAIPRKKKRETDDLMLVLTAFDGFPSLIQLELPDIDDSE